MSRKKQNGYHIQNGGLKCNIKTSVILKCNIKTSVILLFYRFKNVASHFKIDCKSGNKLHLN